MTRTLQGAVLGHPIGHSKSPAIHEAAYTLLGADFTYRAIDVEVPDLAELLAQVRRDGNWYGLSVTMPLKNAAVGLMDSLTPVAAALGAVNTIVCTTDDAGHTHLLGDNTDVAGMVNALRYAGIRPQPRAAILGGGGTAVSAIAALNQLGATETTVFVRNPGKAAATMEVSQRLGADVVLASFDDAARALAGYDVVISTLPPYAGDSLAADFLTQDGADSSDALLLDVAYDPWPSALGSAWEARGGTVVAGIEMLLYQGVEQVALFTEAGGYGTLSVEKSTDVTDVMCDSLGVPRRKPHEQNMAG